MKKASTIFTILLLTISVAFGQYHTVEKRRVIEKQNNADLHICYPHFLSGTYADTLNQEVYDFYVNNNKVKQHVAVTDNKTLEFMFRQTAQKLSDIGLQKSIDPIDYLLYSGWGMFENKYIISMVLDQYVDMGTAHPDVFCTIVNINKETNKLMSVADLIKKDTAVVLEVAAKIFCKDRNLPTNALRLQTGLKYELADIPMPKKCGFSPKGIVLFYGRGEIASLSFPAIYITVPYSDFKNALPEGFLNNIVATYDGFKEGAKKLNEINRKEAKYAKPRKYRRN